MRKHSLIARIVTSLIGFVLIVYGVIAALSPLPAGVPLLVLGLIMIAGANPAARPIIRKMRARWRWFDKLVRLIGERGSSDIKDVVEETRPDAENEQATEAAEERGS